MPRYKVADVIFKVVPKYDYSIKLMKDYVYSGEEPTAFEAKIAEEDIAKERLLAPDFPDSYLESLAILRKLCDYTLVSADGMIFHSSAVAVDGEGYLFAAPSGTGKSTHARLWKEVLGDKMTYINDDKPIIRFIDGKFYVYGTPWDGKHRLSSNARVPVKAICELRRAKENSIRKVTPSEILSTVLNQTVRPGEAEKLDKLLSLVGRLLGSVSLYSLGCNVSREAAEISYGTMSKGD